MPIYIFENSKGERIEEIFPMSDVPSRIRRDGRMYRRVVGGLQAFKMPIESSLRYQQWFHSDAVQAKLKSGEYEIMPKSHEINQH